jgi:hypothetical protein
MIFSWIHNRSTRSSVGSRRSAQLRRLDLEQLEIRRLLAFDLNLIPSAEYSAIPGAVDASNRAAAVYETLFGDDITINIELALRDDLQPEVGSVAGTEIEFVDYGPVRDALVADSKADADYAGRALPSLNKFSVDLPVGFALEDNNGADPNEVDVAASRAIRKAIGLVAPHSAIVDGAVFLNSDATFDTDNSDGISAGSADLESLLLHEFGHILGFTSVVNDIDFSVELGIGGRTEPHVLDLFRFDADNAANPTNLVDFAQADRSLEPGVNAITDILTSELPMSTGQFNGDGFRTGHWQDESVGGQYYGLFDPLDDFSAIRSLTEQDIMGLDILGYDYIQDTVTPTVINTIVNGATSDPADLAKGPQPTSWLTQQSRIANIEVNFSRPMVVTASDLRLTNLGVNAPTDADVVFPLTPQHLQTNDQQLVISFAHSELADGIYQLEILGSAVDAGSTPLDGNGDGTTGDDYVLIGSRQNGLFKMTSDFNADTGVSVFDFTTFSYWFGTSVGIAPEYADLNNDSGVSVFDFTFFANAFGSGVTFPTGFHLQTLTPQDSFEQEIEPQEELIEQVVRVRPMIQSPEARHDAETPSDLLQQDDWTQIPLEDLLGSLHPSGLPAADQQDSLLPGI